MIKEVILSVMTETLRWMKCFLVLLGLALLSDSPVSAWQSKEIRYRSTVDDTDQNARFYVPSVERPVPLMVILHTWSGDYQQTYHQEIEKWCVENAWAYIHPDFRGPNRRAEATGSDLAISDVICAVRYAQANANVDSAAIFLIGTSGGGHAALLMAGRHAEIWAGVSAWVPISDLAAWHRQCKKTGLPYVQDMVDSCGGAPGDSPVVDRQYARRSPLTYLPKARGVPVHIHAGIQDGHTGSVPISHSLYAFNRLAEVNCRLSESDIQFFVNQADVPPQLKMEIKDPSYGSKRPLFRRTSSNATLTIFDGQHELIAEAALDWIIQIHEQRDGPKKK